MKKNFFIKLKLHHIWPVNVCTLILVPDNNPAKDTKRPVFGIILCAISTFSVLRIEVILNKAFKSSLKCIFLSILISKKDIFFLIKIFFNLEAPEQIITTL